MDASVIQRSASPFLGIGRVALRGTEGLLKDCINPTRRGAPPAPRRSWCSSFGMRLRGSIDWVPIAACPLCFDDGTRSVSPLGPRVLLNCQNGFYKLTLSHEKQSADQRSHKDTGSREDFFPGTKGDGGRHR